MEEKVLARNVKNYVKKKTSKNLRISLLQQLKELKHTKGESHLTSYISATDIYNKKQRRQKKCQKLFDSQLPNLFVNNSIDEYDPLDESSDQTINDGRKTFFINKEQINPLDFQELLESKTKLAQESENHYKTLLDKELETLRSKENQCNHNKSSNLPEGYLMPKLKTIFIERTNEIIDFRSKLPIMNQEHDILEEIRHNVSIVISGSTGCGKTTQIPQFLYEAGYSQFGRIGITQPRRVAATSLASRVSYEMGSESKKVGYQIRYDCDVNKDTKIKFMTDGILIQEMKNDFMLNDYSVIIIDEAHERSVFTDILIGLLTRVALKRHKENKPLKLIIMSATLFLDEFIDNNNLFPQKPGVISIESRLYKTIIHHSKRTPEDYIDAALHKVMKIHNNMSNGSILVFLTSKKDIIDFVDKLTSKKIPDLIVLPFYSLLDPENQNKVFLTYNNNMRIVIAATNIAETSITIPNIKYVIDCGKAKSKVYDRITGTSRFELCWISKASAIQRSGRAGRLSDGHVFRLYSLALYGNMAEYSMPEILKVPLEQIVLQLKCLGVHKIKNFPFITAPDSENITKAENNLERLDFLEKKIDIKTKLEIFVATNEAMIISHLPILPKYSKALLEAYKRFGNRIIRYLSIIISCLSVTEIFIDLQLRQKFIKEYIITDFGYKVIGDMFLYLKLFGIVSFDRNYIRKLFLKSNSIDDIFKLNSQLINIINHIWPDLRIDENDLIEPPSEIELKQILYCLISASVDNVAYLVDFKMIESIPNSEKKAKSTKIKTKLYQIIDFDNNSTIINNLNDDSLKNLCLIHPNSLLNKMKPKFLIFQSSISVNNQILLLDCCPIDSQSLSQNLSQLLNHENGSESTKQVQTVESLMANDISIPSYYDRNSGKVCHLQSVWFGPQKWPLGQVNIPFRNGLCSILRLAMHIIKGDVFTIPNIDSNLLEQNILYSFECLKAKNYAKYSYSQQLINKMIEFDIFDRKSLSDKFLHDPLFLYNEVSQWFNHDLHQRIFNNWRQVILK